MHVKTRGHTCSLYRSVWVSKGTQNNSHGFSRQKFVASLSNKCTEVPPDVAALLTDEEVAFVDRRVCEKARTLEFLAQHAREKREKDPLWRIAEATRLLDEAAVRSENALVPDTVIAKVSAAASRVQTLTPAATRLATAPAQTDPLRDALAALKTAAQAVRSGRYGSGPAEGMKSTAVYARWLELQSALEGTDESSLMRSLQARGFVKTRQR